MGKTFFSGKILHALRSHSTVNINDMVEHNRASINAQLNKKIMEGVFSTGALVDFKVTALVVGKDLLRAQTRARATAAIVVTKL
jgi:hypothetical protein